MLTTQLTVTFLYDGSKWVALLERRDEAGYSACEVVVGYSEPLLAEVHELLLSIHRTLQFSAPVPLDSVPEAAARPLNYKRMQRESRRLTEESDALVNVRDAAREDRARRKAEQAAAAKAAREAEEEQKYKLKQEKKKAKQRGH